jgi:hypothetical protein
MLETDIPFEPGFSMEKLEIPDPEWAMPPAGAQDLACR